MARHHRNPHHRGNTHPATSTLNPRGDRSAASSTDKYGVWLGTPTSYAGQTLEQDKSPHITLKFTSSSKTVEANINVASTSTDTKLVYWLNKTFTHPLTTTLSSLSEGFHQATSTNGSVTDLSLDFIRTSPALLSFAAGQVVQDSDASTSNNILSELEPIINDAISQKAKVYIFGRDYGTGIDDVHMNQGNTGAYQNAVGTDGALIFSFSDGHFEAIFLAFASQEVPTDNSTGAPSAGAKELETIATGTGA